MKFNDWKNFTGIQYVKSHGKLDKNKFSAVADYRSRCANFVNLNFMSWQVSPGMHCFSIFGDFERCTNYDDVESFIK